MLYTWWSEEIIFLYCRFLPSPLHTGLLRETSTYGHQWHSFNFHSVGQSFSFNAFWFQFRASWLVWLTNLFLFWFHWYFTLVWGFPLQDCQQQYWMEFLSWYNWIYLKKSNIFHTKEHVNYPLFISLSLLSYYIFFLLSYSFLIFESSSYPHILHPKFLTYPY